MPISDTFVLKASKLGYSALLWGCQLHTFDENIVLIALTRRHGCSEICFGLFRRIWIFKEECLFFENCWKSLSINAIKSEYYTFLTTSSRFVKIPGNWTR